MARALAAIAGVRVHALELSGYVGAEARAFPQTPAFARQRRHAVSLVAQPELYHQWQDGRHSVVLVPYLRLDSADAERSHFDVREALYQRAEDRWELRLGVGRVFWGVAESRHLVDVINQTDLVENVDGEDKLGQPMVNLTLKMDLGTVDVFVLTGFRERTFPGPRGRLRSQPFVDADRASYESSAERKHVDLALRWSRFIGDFDVGVSHFVGTSRDPRLIPVVDPGAAPVLVPRYEQVHRTALDLQATKGAWLWKLEALHQSGQGPSFVAWVAGFEATRFGIAGTDADLGLLAEHLFDSRGAHATQPFENDLFLGMRLALNDAAGSELLSGVIHDLDGDGDLLAWEASRRVGNRWRLELEGRLWSGIPSLDLQAPLRRDDYLQFRLLRYF
jgi:hypothetical protein